MAPESTANPDAMMADTTIKPKEPGPGLWLSLAILTIGFTACCFGGYLAFQSAFELLSIDSFETPGEQTRTLDPGEYEIYLRSGSVSILDFDMQFDDFSGDVGQITVTDVETGEPVAIEPFRTSEPLGRSSNVYEAVAAFEITSKGRFTVSVNPDGPSRAVFGRSIESSLDRVVPWLILAAVGVVFFILGVVLLVVGMVRRKKHRTRQTTQPVMQPAMQPATPARPPTEPPTPLAPTHNHRQPPAPRPTETETPWDN